MQASRRCSAAWVALLACGSGTLYAEDFFPTRDQNPLLRGFYLPLPADSGPGARLSATLQVSNTFNVESNAHETLHVDGESAALDLGYENALSQTWRYRFTVPVIHDSGGVLDSAIDTWHQLFGFSRGYRPYYPKRQLEYSYSGRGTIDLNHAETGVEMFRPMWGGTPSTIRGKPCRSGEASKLRRGRCRT